MDASVIKLTFKQKIKPFIKAINSVIPLSLIFAIVLSVSNGIFIASYCHSTLPKVMFFLGVVLITFGMLAFLTAVFRNLIKPTINEILKNYELEKEKVKQEILDNSIENHILK